MPMLLVCRPLFEQQGTPRPSRRAGAGVAALGARRRLPRGRAGLQGLGTAPPTRGCTVAAAAVALRLLPRLPASPSGIA